jgi:putative nucleotidyltransferase with HDIG domain
MGHSSPGAGFPISPPTPFRGDAMTALARPSGSSSMLTITCAADALHDARTWERAGSIPEAVHGFETAIELAERRGEDAVLAEALRRLAILRHQRDDSAQARQLCRRSYEVATRIGNNLLAAESLNTLGGLEMTTDSLTEARTHFLQALRLGASSRELRARVEQNLGILANIQGELDQAENRYRRSLKAYQNTGDEHGCALAYHNLGMVSADREQFEQADSYFSQSRTIAERAGYVFLQGLCLVNHAEVHLARQHFEDAEQSAEGALAIFEQLGARAEIAGALRVIGAVYRETGRFALADIRLRSSLELAASAGSILNEAEGSRELALLHQAMGRNQDALRLLNRAHGLFGRLDARRDLVHVAAKMAELEDTYFAVVREWGQSIESNDSYTFGHCERVARNAAAVARALGFDEPEQTTIRLGAYLHDVGKVRVPPAILNKPGPLTQEEFSIIQMHPVWGVELLAGVEFPWDLKPIIRWHHERYDGTGYPDGLRGDDMPASAQIVGIADVYDALTTDRAYRAAMHPAQALAEISTVRQAWSAPVFEGFLAAFPELCQHQGDTASGSGGAHTERAA